jgi:hypothetical protein
MKPPLTMTSGGFVFRTFQINISFRADYMKSAASPRSAEPA